MFDNLVMNAVSFSMPFLVFDFSDMTVPRKELMIYYFFWLNRFHEFLKQENEVGNITRQEAVSMVCNFTWT